VACGPRCTGGRHRQRGEPSPPPLQPRCRRARGVSLHGSGPRTVHLIVGPCTVPRRPSTAGMRVPAFSPNNVTARCNPRLRSQQPGAPSHSGARRWTATYSIPASAWSVGCVAISLEIGSLRSVAIRTLRELPIPAMPTTDSAKLIADSRPMPITLGGRRSIGALGVWEVES